MQDNQAINVKISDERISHFALFIDCDYISFKRVVKETKQEARDAEISAIDK